MNKKDRMTYNFLEIAAISFIEGIKTELSFFFSDFLATKSENLLTSVNPLHFHDFNLSRSKNPKR